jgi:hypothetical protein
MLMVIWATQLSTGELTQADFRGFLRLGATRTDARASELSLGQFGLRVAEAEVLVYVARTLRHAVSSFAGYLFASLRRRARLCWQIGDPQCGAVTFVQRLGGALNLNVHFHTLALDGAYDTEDGMRFRPLPPPDDDDVARVTRLPDAPFAGERHAGTETR